jgi:hypothetical protein
MSAAASNVLFASPRGAQANPGRALMRERFLSYNFDAKQQKRQLGPSPGLLCGRRRTAGGNSVICTSTKKVRR